MGAAAVTYAGNTRLMRRMEKKFGKKHNPWLEAVYAIDRKTRATLALVDVALILAGTDKLPIVRNGGSLVDNATAEAHADPAPPRGRRPVWSETVRPGRDDILTWDEAMRVPWIEGNGEDDER